MNNAKIEVYAWVKVNSKGYLVRPQDGDSTWHKFLTIGHNRFDLAALLVTYPLQGHIIDSKFLKIYNIDPKYQGAKMAIIHVDHLRYGGCMCNYCYQYFEYLQDEYLTCWKCEI